MQSLVEHDAISTHARHLQRILRDMGLRSEIYAGEQRAGRGAAQFFRDFSTMNPSNRTWLLYHLSTGSPLAGFLKERPEHVAVNYHNVTPAELFAPWEPVVGIELEAARHQLLDLASATEFAIGVSEYNEQELRRAGYSRTEVAPVLFDPADFERDLDLKLDAKLRAKKDSGGADWLFVGRVAPHKGQHDLIKAFALYQRLYDERARLHIVGGMSSHHYWTVLGRYVDALQLRDSVNITGGVSNGALGAYYRNADVFVSASEHEGFGVPLLEAMHNRLPVVAYGAAAIPETLGDSGLILNDKSPSFLAAAVDHVLSDAALSKALTDRGRERLAAFSLTRSEARWRQVIESMLKDQQ